MAGVGNPNGVSQNLTVNTTIFLDPRSGINLFISVSLVIPYRDRSQHLKDFLHWIHPFMQVQNLSYTVYVIEQLPGKPFNRAKLFNIGYLEAKVCFFKCCVEILEK